MDEYIEAEDIPSGLPLTADELAHAHYDVPRHLGAMPFGPDDMITRGLWVVFMGVWGIWTHAILPLDNRLDMGDPESIAGTCTLVAGLIAPSACHEDEEAVVVLRRPAPPDPSPADEHIFRLIRAAAATRETASWSFFITGPDGARELNPPATEADPYPSLTRVHQPVRRVRRASRASRGTGRGATAALRADGPV